MQDVNLNRFIDRMAQLITKYADAVDWNELPDPDYEKLNIDENMAETSVSAFCLKKGYTEERLRVTLFIGVWTKQQSKRREGESNGRFGKSLFIH